MNDLFQSLMLEATRLTRTGRLDEATRTIQRALATAVDASPAGTAPDGTAPAGTAPAGTAPAGASNRGVSDRGASDRGASHDVIDGCVFEVDERTRPLPGATRADAGTDAARTAPLTDGPGHPPLPDDGRDAFVDGRHAHGSMSRDCKLYVPPGAAGRALPLVVMLHGCTQDPDDFAAGTGMNERAREQGFFVLYPAQSAKANPQRCWNWFKHTHQSRHRGEPALIASMTQAVVRRHGLDARRVYIAGLSAGGAMAAVTAACYPDVFAAVGVHSGLAAGAASSLPEALAAMRDGAAAGAAPAPDTARVPTIVFHGDQDRTVHPRNGAQVIDAQVRGRGAADTARVEHGTSARGRRFTRHVHAGDATGADAEHWIVHGAGHAWSGGRRDGSFTDPAGPDATGEMLRFFFARTLGATH